MVRCQICGYNEHDGEPNCARCGTTFPPEGETEPETSDDAPADLNGDGAIDDLESKTKAELTESASSLGVDVKAGDTKADIIAAIHAAANPSEA
jgi:hypothetical protein